MVRQLALVRLCWQSHFVFRARPDCALDSDVSIMCQGYHCFLQACAAKEAGGVEWMCG